MSGLHLVHDVLDAQLIDRRKEKIGRVDALMLELEPDRPPRVATICIGGPERAHRIGRWMVWLSRLLRALMRLELPNVSRIPFDTVRCIGDTIELDVDGRELDASQLERWISEHVISRIPGARRGKQ
jgi:hypothetical protein